VMGERLSARCRAAHPSVVRREILRKNYAGCRGYPMPLTEAITAACTRDKTRDSPF
jgi:hypothetical protein